MAENGVSLRDLGNGGSAVEELYKRLLSEGGGTPHGAMVQSDVNRGAAEGSPSSWAKGMTPAQLAQLDRYAWGAQIADRSPVTGALSLLPVIGYEGVKALAPGVLGAVGRMLPAGEEMKVDETTSPASMGNVRALIAGYRR